MAAYVPYKYNPAEMPPEDMEATFVGRHHVLNRLVEAVREQSEASTIQHYLLLGPRGIGKTTLLLMLKRRIQNTPELADRWMPVQYREEEFYVYTFRDLLALALETLSAEANIPEAEGILIQAEAETDDDKSLAIILDGLKRISDTHQKRILLLIDNFDRLFPKRSANETDHRAFRKLLMTASHLMVVGTSVRLFEDIATYDEAFFHFFSPVPIENLSDDEIQELLLTRAQNDNNTDFLNNYEEHKEKIRAITFLTGGNPRLIMMLYEILSRKRVHDVVQALRETIDNLTPLLKDVLEDLPRQQSKILDALMRLGGVASPSDLSKRTRLSLNAVTTQIGRLKQTRLIEVQGEGRGKPALCRVRDQMFKTWYQMRYLRPARRRVEMLVEFLRAWFSVEDLAKELANLNSEFTTALSSGRQARASEAVVGMDYFAASIEDPIQRTRHLERVAESYAEIGDLREAALSLAELKASDMRSERLFEAIGYTSLGDLLQKKGNLTQAQQTYTEAIKRDPQNVESWLGLGLCAGLTGDHEKSHNAFDRILQIPNIDIQMQSRALSNRGVAKSLLGDTEGAIDDYTAVIELENAPVDQIAKALNNRGVAYGKQDDHKIALKNFDHAVNLKGISEESRLSALQNRGRAYEYLNNITAAIADYTQCATSHIDAEIVHNGLLRLFRLFSKLNRISEIKTWIARIDELEPANMSEAQKLDFRINLITTIAQTTSIDAAIDLLNGLIDASKKNIQEKLNFLKSGLEFARTGDEAVLARLPEEEQAIARRIADTIKPREEGGND